MKPLIALVLALVLTTAAQATDQLWWPDADADTYGYAGAQPIKSADPPGPDYVQNGDDCDDGDASINPAATEVCDNGMDDDCDGQIDEGCSPTSTEAETWGRVKARYRQSE